MPHITTCRLCNVAYEAASEEAANAPGPPLGRWDDGVCERCWYRKVGTIFDVVAHKVERARVFGVLPADIQQSWPNADGFIRRVPGQRHYRPPPKTPGLSVTRDEPNESEIRLFVENLIITYQRVQHALGENP